MAADDDDDGGGRGRVDCTIRPPRPFSVRGTHRQKHHIRAIFRSASLLLLVGGFALYHRFVGDPSGGSVIRGVDQGGAGIGNTGLRNGGHVAGTMAHLENSVGDGGHHEYHLSRLLEGEDDEASCPVLVKADPTWLAAFYSIGILYMFLALAIVCDEFFVPALEEISSEHHLDLSMDVAGATLMAAGGSAPELFTSLVGTFQESDIGIGTIVGSAVFNVLFVIGTCSILSKEVLTLTWWPLFRDSSYYALGLIVLSLLAGVFSKGVVDWWEAVILLLMYVGYVVLMYFNRKIYTKLTGKELVLGSEQAAMDELAETTTNGSATAAVATGGAAENGHGPTDATATENGVNHSPSSSDNFEESSTRNLATTSVPTAKRSSDFRWPGTFRAGVLKLLLHPENWEEKAGLGIVAKIQGDVEHVFKQIDINGDGNIDQEELGNLFEKLDHEISEEDLGEVFKSLDLDGDGTICEEEFSKWYIKSEERILSKVKPIFDTLDSDKSGAISRDEVRELLKTLIPTVKESDVDDAIKAMYKTGATDEITYEEFADWYVHSIIYTRQQTLIDKQMEEESQGVCESLTPPRGEGCFAWLKYLLVLPLVAVLTFTIPDVRRPGYGRWCYLSFILSIIWIGIFSFFMVGWTEILGNTMGVPSVVMGYTVLAAGTSVPDLLSSVIVARMGEGDMAVSSSIGSNIFDILVGLPLPWLIFILVPSKPDHVTIQAKGIWQSIFILIAMLVAIIAIVHCQGW
eukprot:CAMPEP_0172303976 /NCGR_PEP_ID=MMETSP1058-20130122/5441_1 /TAXON_ID=83371 /ORGANISM="Detonula confervacea, Strain CCMP 353" /LENGTH=743 /DNA_ID=CAMNT_0013015015 /DNA_START=370 /DNA_END=2598 /DNA_ORIENTATION=+